ncbi:hypothetical protein HNY73_015990 [Argiope bruennichi]|uniref:Uncharacterized protein n=1 Tax=Argiope bruennichi TaxID=94029 RepID=A0A8T0EM93_ARGBR|nr:hypothetical protein HNY73_015990 [Argiope bruennichi]
MLLDVRLFLDVPGGIQATGALRTDHEHVEELEPHHEQQLCHTHLSLWASSWCFLAPATVASSLRFLAPATARVVSGGLLAPAVVSVPAYTNLAPGHDFRVDGYGLGYSYRNPLGYSNVIAH